MTDQALDPGAMLRWSGLGPVTDYWIDAFQRSVLFFERAAPARQYRAGSQCKAGGASIDWGIMVGAI